MENQVIKVCVRVPNDKKDILLAFAEGLRGQNETSSARPQGWDAKAVHEIARNNYGTLLKLFEHHGWPERGSDMMRQVQAQVKKQYGSVDNFVSVHKEA